MSDRIDGPSVEGAGGMSGAPRRPSWLRKDQRQDGEVMAQRRRIAGLGLHTVCQSARCPNLAECYTAGNATFLILGDHCTRSCAFCAVGRGAPEAPDPAEGARIAEHMRGGGIRYAVITSVTRDDLPDGGASHFAAVVAAVRAVLPEVGLELLVPDFRGAMEAVDLTAALPVQVWGHNLETVASLYGTARRGADYRRSLAVLERAASRRSPDLRVKTGVMVGLGERREELERLFVEAAGAGVDILTIGQYLRPSWDRLPVARYLAPAEFDELSAAARAAGIEVVVAGPYVRSSYLAERAWRGERGAGGRRQEN